MGSDEEDVREVYEVEQQQEFVATEEYVAKLEPLVSEEDWQLAHRRHVQRTSRQPIKQGFFANIHRSCLYAFEIVLEALQHRIADLLEVLIVAFIQHLRDRVRYH